MIRGEYVWLTENGEERVIPNQFTIVGMQLLLKAAFWQQIPTLRVGLCSHNPASFLGLTTIQEPTGANGYVRQLLTMNQANWPVISSVNGESYIESREFVFALTGEVSNPVNRFFLTDGVSVVSISSALPDGLQIYDSPIVSKYRLFFS